MRYNAILSVARALKHTQTSDRDGVLGGSRWRVHNSKVKNIVNSFYMYNIKIWASEWAWNHIFSKSALQNKICMCCCEWHQNHWHHLEQQMETWMTPCCCVGRDYIWSLHTRQALLFKADVVFFKDCEHFSRRIVTDVSDVRPCVLTYNSSIKALELQRFKKCFYYYLLSLRTVAKTKTSTVGSWSLSTCTWWAWAKTKCPCSISMAIRISISLQLEIVFTLVHNPQAACPHCGHIMHRNPSQVLTISARMQHFGKKPALVSKPP